MSTQEESNLKAFEDLVKVASVGGPTPFSWQGRITLAPVSPQTGEWYFCIECAACHTITAAFRDFAQGKLRLPFSGDGQIRLSCQRCHQWIDLPATDLGSLKWP